MSIVVIILIIVMIFSIGKDIYTIFAMKKDLKRSATLTICKIYGKHCIGYYGKKSETEFDLFKKLGY